VEVLLDAVAADGHRAVLDHGLPEECGGLLHVLVVRQFADALEADHLRDLGVRVQAGQLVLVLFERLQDGLVRELQRQRHVARIARHRGDVGQHLVHAAMLAPEHGLHLRVAQAAGQAQRPVGQRDQHRLRVLVAGVAVGVAQAGVDLVQVIPGHPLAVDREVVGVELAGGDIAPGRAAAGDAAQVAVAVRLLRALEFRDEVVEAFLDGGVAGRGEHQRQRRQVVAAHVAVEAGRLPVAVAGLLHGSPASRRKGASRRSGSIAIR
jgi:hypothetical protein